jgi:cytochrome c-type biogenesis protein CcmH/NrfF
MIPAPTPFEPSAAVIVTAAWIAPYMIILIGARIYALSKKRKDNER